MPMMNGNRTGVAWQVCARCGWQYPLSEMGWQLGALICFAKCWDNPLVLYPGQREARIARVLERVPNGGEPELEPKLTKPGNDPLMY